MSITSSTNSSENLSPDERLILQSGVRNEPQGEESTKEMAYDHHQAYREHLVAKQHAFAGMRSVHDDCPSHRMHHVQCTIYPSSVSSANPLYENSKSYKYSTNSTSNGNYSTILELPRTPPPSSNYHSSSSTGTSTLSIPVGCSDSSGRFSISGNDHFSSGYASAQSKSVDHYVNLQPGPPPPQYAHGDFVSAFSHNMYTNNTSNCGSFSLLESHSSNGSRSCSTTPESKSNERLSIFSKSHPDLSRLDEDIQTKSVLYIRNVQAEQSKFSSFDVLKAENTFLKSELESCLKKVTKMHKFEKEIQKVHQMYEDLMQSSEKKEKLERAVRYKLEIEIKRLQQLNKQLKDQVNATLAASKCAKSTEVCNEEMKEEVQKTDVLIGQLLTQNKEMLNIKERQEIELQAQRLTLEEQRKHIEILDSALMNAQNNVIALENNLRKKLVYEERANHLQKALANLQLSSERRLQMEKRARTQLEKEIELLKSSEKQKKNGLSISASENELDNLKKLTREYEEKIINLEGEVSNWEQKYLEENTMRQIEVNAASVPKDAKIAALEKTSQQTEKLIAEARSERLKHMDELHEASKKTAELEEKIKDLESKLAEKEAMIKVLQQHSETRDNVLQQSIIAQRTTLGRHTRSVSSMGLVNANTANNGTAITRTFKNLSLCGNASNTIGKFTERTNNSSNPVANYNFSLISGSNNTASGNISAQASGPVLEKKSVADLDEQLKELDKRLTNKDSIIRALQSERERYPNHFWMI